MKVFILGAGKVGTCLARALRGVDWSVLLRPARGFGLGRMDAELVILAVRDDQIAGAAARLTNVVPSKTVVLHLSASQGPEALAALRDVCRGVGLFHPLVAFADRRACPSLRGAFALVDGDRAAIAAGRAMARALGMRAWAMPNLDRAAYHAAAGMVAAGAVGLVQAAVEVLRAGGIAPEHSARILAPLLRSVSENVAGLGLPGALTGVVRRGDAERAETQLLALASRAPAYVALYREVLRVQLPLCRTLGEADERDLERMGRLLTRFESGRPSGRRSIAGG